jgi:hypothetical protein
VTTGAEGPGGRALRGAALARHTAIALGSDGSSGTAAHVAHVARNQKHPEVHVTAVGDSATLESRSLPHVGEFECTAVGDFSLTPYRNKTPGRTTSSQT